MTLARLEGEAAGDGAGEVRLEQRAASRLDVGRFGRGHDADTGHQPGRIPPRRALGVLPFAEIEDGLHGALDYDLLQLLRDGAGAIF